MVNGGVAYRRSGAPGSSGWVLLALLFLLAALATGMAAIGTVWATLDRREKEAELLFVGEQFRRAIESYHASGPGPDHSYPPSLEELLQDRRFPMPVRHLRRLYPDPMTGQPEWGLVRDARGGITGVYSLSEDKPMKEAGFPPQQEGFAGATSYRDWVFQARPPQKATMGKTGAEAPSGTAPDLPRPPGPPRHAVP